MPLAWAVQGATKVSQEISWTEEDGDPVNLTDAILSGKILPKNGVIRLITGNLNISSPLLGIFTWEYSLQDVSTEGDHEVQISALYPDTKINRTKSEFWYVNEDISL